ncbi:MAG: chemotaxis protein CheX [Treponema sp.]|nr:chemotaxis protein CheX [Treponema sp.]
MDILELYVKPFVKSTLHTFKDFVGMDLVVGNPHFSGRTLVFDRDISAVIGLSGAVRGAVVVSLQRKFALEITGKLIGSEPADLDDDVVDAIGEIVNIIAGNIKQYVEGGEQIVISLPTIVKGKGHKFAWPGKSSRILCVSFKHGNDAFFLLADMVKA